MTTWLFLTPMVQEGPASWEDRLFLRIKLARGVTVLEGPPGSYRAVRFPTQDEIAAATAAYIGGHEYDVDDATKAALIAAGVGVTDANFIDTATLHGFGSGLFGEGAYGG